MAPECDQRVARLLRRFQWPPNKAAAETPSAVDGVHACTDLTGIDLIGHAAEVANASGVTLLLEEAKVPLLQAVRALVLRNRIGGMVTSSLPPIMRRRQ